MAAVGSERISEEFAGHGFRNCRMVVGARARAGCLALRRVAEKGLSLVIYFVLYFCRLGASQEQCRVFGLVGFQAGMISCRLL